ncbi:hypothetical protein Q4E93_18675 [Flavitalea sp. BT771]|uniref:hypothetical protein n=1 Tax=Flavitalea sp. BT771 TaxID=3063329 RepID=UPI0026E38B4D|nr:hypothetical protein [Flavitalea sp. BT771]MDO6432637.1 hypothetical protein [Flavitalea sp. BT771]MDV6222087.1 hypothetical protein [Flavitalea sp. BT771]
MTKDATEVKIKIGEYELTSSRQTSEIFIKPILNEIDEAIATLTEQQRKEFSRIYNQIEVEGRDVEVPGDFIRNSDYHYILRALRNINFIQPFGGGNWKPGQKIRIRNMGRLAAKLRAKDIGFK